MGTLLRVICDVCAAWIDRDRHMEDVAIEVCEMEHDGSLHLSALREGGEAV